MEDADLFDDDDSAPASEALDFSIDTNVFADVVVQSNVFGLEVEQDVITFLQAMASRSKEDPTNIVQPSFEFKLSDLFFCFVFNLLQLRLVFSGEAGLSFFELSLLFHFKFVEASDATEFGKFDLEVLGLGGLVAVGQ